MSPHSGLHHTAPKCHRHLVSGCIQWLEDKRGGSAIAFPSVEFFCYFGAGRGKGKQQGLPGPTLGPISSPKLGEPSWSKRASDFLVSPGAGPKWVQAGELLLLNTGAPPMDLVSKPGD